MAWDAVSDPRRAVAPGTLYSSLTVALVVLIGALALTVRQTPPPPVAEFAPQVRQIRQAPPEQALIGDPVGGRLQEVQSPPPTIRPPGGVKVVPRQLRCVGIPPRQTEDPQSPPCIAFWQGDNGGSTYQGVTRDEIRLLVPTSQNDSVRRLYAALEKHFNTRYQFYGRRLRFVYSRTNTGSADPAEQKAHAADDVPKFKPFVVTDYKSAQGYWYQQEIGRRGILYANATGVYTNRNYRTVYTYIMPAEEVFAGLGEWACKRLVGRNARHAGGDLTVKRRVFGIILSTAPEDPTTADVLKAELARCGAKVGYSSRNEIGVSGVDPATAAGVIVKMQEAGVTSIFCLCQLFNYGAIQTAASRQNYFPEWLTTSFGTSDTNAFIKLGGNPPEQMAHAFGITQQPRLVPKEEEPFYWAAREGDPGYDTSADQSAFATQAYEVYRPLLIIASGIQMAGPSLTNETFMHGLERAKFPNPDHATNPGKVGFPNGRRGMTTDHAEFWWSNTARSPYKGDGAGTFCYVDRGRRHAKGSLPRGSDTVFFRPDTECEF